MKRDILLSLAAVAALVSVAGCAASAPVVHAPCSVSRPFAGDRLTWTFVTPANGVVDAETTAPSGMDDLSYAFTCWWDERGLQVFVLTVDDDVSTDSCRPGATSCPAWDDDAVEVFLDGEYARLPDSRADGGVHLRHGGEFALVANGAANSDYSGYPNSFCREDEACKAVFGGATNALWRGEVLRGDKVEGLRDELRSAPGCPVGFWPEGAQACGYGFHFSWAAMGRTNRPERIGFNIGVQDDDAGGRRDHTLYWTGDPKRPYANESAFGTLMFDDPVLPSTSAARADVEEN
ncbi:MAG: hypothetical protein IJ829_03885 [Kiritimatiellae bacterium]|nr:hypothetical protein [Kiritimatiellia bacterium]